MLYFYFFSLYIFPALYLVFSCLFLVGLTGHYGWYVVMGLDDGLARMAGSMDGLVEVIDSSCGMDVNWNRYRIKKFKLFFKLIFSIAVSFLLY